WRCCSYSASRMCRWVLAWVLFTQSSACSASRWVHQLRALKPWARIAGIVMAILGLFGFPIGTLINGYILYLLLSQKGRRIFQPDYAHIVAATPEVKCRTSIVVWIILGIFLLGILAAISLPFVMRQ